MPAVSLATATSAAAATDSGPDAGPVPTQNTVSDTPPPGTDSLPDPEPPQISAADGAAIASARSEAAKTGKSVVVGALTTETSTISVAPSGRLTYNSSLLPVRVRRGKQWVAVNTTLTPAPGGGFTPTETPTSVVFSGGGTAPLVTMAGPKRTSLALTWPKALPKPVRSGSSLTYRSVLPSVDLVVSATQEGGFHETLVIKTPAAAADPALATLKLGVRAHGVTVSDDGHGNLNATDAEGELLFHAPAAEMWDSNTAPATVSAADAHGGRAMATAMRDAAPAIASTPTSPGSAARVAAIRVHAAKGTISLAPDRALLTSKTAVFPLYVDPNWTALWQTGYKQHFVEIQSGCPTAQNYDSTTYGDPGVGDNTYSGCIGVERTFYQLGVPSAIYGGKVEQAFFNLKETYSASCSVSAQVNVHLSKVIYPTTDWNHQPTTSYLQKATFGPACTSQPSAGYDITGTVQHAADGRWSNITLGVISPNESTSADFKRFATNPTLSIEYDHAPDMPTKLDAKSTANDLGCATSTPYPPVGKTDSVSPITISAHTDDLDGDATQTSFQYWANGSSTKTTVKSANGVASPGTASASIPGSFISGLASGTTVDWQPTSITDGEESTTPPTGTICHFTVYPNTPTLQLTIETQGAENTASTVQAKSDASDPATVFVYQLDTPPPSTYPAAGAPNQVTATNGTATISVTPPGPGRHILNVIGFDSAKNATAVTPIPLDISGATGQTYPSFSDALNDTTAQSTGNTAISTNTATNFANADGGGHSLSVQDLTAAGWTSGGHVTLDGANFTLPTFSTSTSQVHDNLLADNQTIGLGGASGQSLVMLAFGTWADYEATKDTTGDSTLPHVAAGTNIVGSDCTMNNSTTTVNGDDCQAASGTIHYADTSVGTNGDVPYYLSVPDWSAGTPSVSVLTLPHRNLANNGQQTQPMYLYAFAVHLAAGKAVSSITLPDISGPAHIAGGNASGAPVLGTPALHIMGLAFRDTTSAGAGKTWTGAWEGAPDDTYAYTGGAHWTNLTMRDSVVPSVSGDSVRVHLSNQQSNTPLTVTHVTVADQQAVAASATTTVSGQTISTPGLSPVPQGTPVNATFGSGNSTSVTIPAGGDIYSNPIGTGVTVTAGEPLLISTAVSDAPVLSGHSWSTDERQWITASGAGDVTTDTTGTPFTATGSLTGEGIDIVSGVDTTTTSGVPTVVVLGDGLYRPDGSTTETPANSSAGPRLSDALAASLASQTTTPDYGVVNAGIEDNSLISGSTTTHGLSALSRLDRDIMSEPGLQTVVIDEGLTDALAAKLQPGSTAQQIEDPLTSAYVSLQNELAAWGIKVVFTTMTPCGGDADCTTTAEAVRHDLNSQMTDSWPTVTPGLQQAVVTEDADQAVSADPTAVPEVLNAAYDTGDHVNLNPTGYALTGLPPAFPVSDLTPSTIPLGLPSVPIEYQWPMAEGTGTSTVDTINQQPLDLTNTTWGTDSTLPGATGQQATNPAGNRPAFNGATSYGQLDGAIDPTQSYVIDVWARLDSADSTDQWAVSQNNVGQQAFTVGYDGSTQKWVFETLASDGSTTTLSSSTTASAGQWTHLVASYTESASGPGTVRFDIGGVQVGSSPLTPAAYDPTDPASANDFFTIGGATTGDPSTLSGQLDGELSDLSLFF